jgi:membrane protease YdiL (CAAX protease family)
MQKIVKIALIVIGLLGAVLWFMLPERDMPAAEAAQSGAMNFMFIITYFLLAVAVVVSLLFTLKNLFSNPQGLKKTLFVVGGFVLVVIISYVLSSGTDVSDEFMAMSDESTVKNIGMGLNVFFILTIIAVASLIIPAVKNMFSK